MLDTVRDSLETCFYSRDYHIPHHFGYSFEIRFREFSLRYWSVLYSDFLADYCWAEDSWLMMLDSLFGCALDIHTGAYPPFFWDSYLLLDGMTIFIHGYRDVWLILTDSLLYIRYPHWGILPPPWWDCIWAVVRGWMIIVYCLPHDFDIGYPYWGIFPSPWRDFVWVVVRGWMISVGCLPHDFDIGSYTGAYFPHFLWVSLRLRQWPAWF